jgi:hypothetical protein
VGSTGEKIDRRKPSEHERREQQDVQKHTMHAARSRSVVARRDPVTFQLSAIGVHRWIPLREILARRSPRSGRAKRS